MNKYLSVVFAASDSIFSEVNLSFYALDDEFNPLKHARKSYSRSSKFLLLYALGI
jgi:hypothetical protein